MGKRFLIWHWNYWKNNKIIILERLSDFHFQIVFFVDFICNIKYKYIEIRKKYGFKGND